MCVYMYLFIKVISKDISKLRQKTSFQHLLRITVYQILLLVQYDGLSHKRKAKKERKGKRISKCRNIYRRMKMHV